jgi:carboxymethylenebutenolidase
MEAAMVEVVGGMRMRSDTRSTPAGPMGIFAVRPDGEGPFPVVVFFHHGPGLDDGSKKTMARIAAWGYYVVTHDRYHRAEPWWVAKSSDEDQMKQMFTYILSTSEAEVAADLDSLLAWLPTDGAARPGVKGCVGYCIGARSSLCTIRDRGNEFLAAGALHPSLCTTDEPDSAHLGVPGYTGSLYVGFGSEDRSQPASSNVALIDSTNALPKGEAEIHEGANHGYAVYGLAYHEVAADRSYAQIQMMFDRELRA